MIINILTLILVLSQTELAHAGSSTCEKDMTPSAQSPVCPKNGMYSDLMPTKAIALSENVGSGQHNPQMVQALLEADPKNFPTVLFSGTRDTFNSMRKVIEDTVKDPKERERLLNQLVYIGGTTMPWTQDNSQNYIGPDGRPISRQIQTPSYARNLLEKLFDSSVRGSKNNRENLNNELNSALKKECGLNPGAPIVKNTPIRGVDGGSGVGRFDGYLGGNIEGGPGNTCIVGRASFEKSTNPKLNEFDIHTAEVCPKGSTVVEIPTVLSGTGHADEMVKIIKVPGEQPPCNYAVLLSDVDTGYELLKGSQQKFFGFDQGQQDSASAQRSSQVMQLEVFKNFCKFLKDSTLTSAPQTPQTNPQSGRTVASEANDCSQMTNDQVYQAMTTSKHFKILREGYNRRLNEFFKTSIPALQKGSGCTKDARVIKVPAFIDGLTVPTQSGSTDASDYVALLGEGRPLTPSAVNSIQINRSLIMPDPFVPAFKSFTEKKLKALGLQSSFIDTLNNHDQYGNVHCLVQQFQVCRPQ